MRTFSFIFIPLAPRARRARPPERGFTLIEMMVVVLIITLVAAIAVPAVSLRMKSNRTAQAAETISTIYRTAQAQAMGRGSAVLVRYNAGTFQILEGIVGVTDALGPDCAPLPESSCTVPPDRWDATSDRNQVVENYNFVASGDYAVTPITPLDVCFTPSGRTWWNDSGTLQRMNAPVTFTVSRTDSTGFDRVVVLSPTGAARVVAAP